MPIGTTQSGPWLPTQEDDQLLSQTHVLRYQQRLRLEEPYYRPGDPTNHQSLPLIGIAAGVFHLIGLRGSGPDEVIAPYSIRIDNGSNALNANPLLSQFKGETPSKRLHFSQIACVSSKVVGR